MATVFKGLLARGVPPMPFWHLFLRIAIVVLSIIVLGLSAWAMNVLHRPTGLFVKRDTVDVPGYGAVSYDPSGLSSGDSGDGSSLDVATTGGGGEWHGDSAPIFVLFMTIYTLLSTVAISAFEQFLPHHVWRIGPFVTYILNIILLLSAWALAANDATVLHSWGSADLPGWYRKVYASFAATAGLAAILWVVVIVNTAFFTLACLRDPEGSLPPPAGEPPTANMATTPSKVEAGYGAQPTTGAGVLQSPAPVSHPVQ